jgi:hypothetical protein
MDCESTCSPSLRGGCSAAFSIQVSDDGEEELVYVAEVSEQYLHSEQDNLAMLETLCSNLQLLMLKNHGLQAYAIHLLYPRTIPKTTSGKIARQYVKKAYLDTSLKVLYAWKAINISQIGDQELSSSTIEESVSIPMNPLGMPTGALIGYVKRALSISIPSIDHKSMQSNHPILAYGLDSVSGQQFLCELEKIFIIPDDPTSTASSSNQVYALISELLSERDATIHTVAQTLGRGYRQKHRPVMYDSWKLLQEAKQRQVKSKGKSAGILSNDILSKCMLQSNIDSLSFPDGCGRRDVSLSRMEEFVYISLYIFFLLSVLSPIVLILLLYRYFDLRMATSLTIVISTVLYYLPADCYPPAFRTSAFSILAVKYYSYRVILEAPISREIPSIYSFGPHGIFALPPALQALFHEYFTGQNFHVLAADIVFKIPFYNIAARVRLLSR